MFSDEREGCRTPTLHLDPLVPIKISIFLPLTHTPTSHPFYASLFDKEKKLRIQKYFREQNLRKNMFVKLTKS
jgi:hypothetical protein